MIRRRSRSFLLGFGLFICYGLLVGLTLQLGLLIVKVPPPSSITLSLDSWKRTCELETA